MHIGIEATPLRSFQLGGVWRYTECLIRSLCALGRDHRFTLLFFDSFKPWLRGMAPEPPAPNARVRRVKWVPNILVACTQLLSRRIGIGVETFCGPVDVFHSVNALSLPQRRGRSVLSVHDLTCLRFPEHHPWLRVRLFRAGIAASIGRADVIIVPSRSTRNDLLELTRASEERVRVVPYAHAEQFRQIPEAGARAVLERYGLGYGDYILFVGNIEPRKNLSTLVRAYTLLREGLPDAPPLVLVGGKGWRNRSIQEAIGASPVARDIRLLGYLPEADLVAALNGAVLFVYPSLYEGFGLPPLEAMACGVPVITSDVSSLPEVTADAAVMVDPRRADRLAEAMRAVLTSAGTRLAMRAKGLERARAFSWEKTARGTLEAYEMAAAEAGRR